MKASILWLNRVQSASPAVQGHKGVFLRRICWIPCIWPRIWWITRRQNYSLSNAGVCLSYHSCPAWWTKFISHEKCTLKTNLKCVLDKWEGEHLTEGGWKVFGGGSLWQLEAVVWSVRHCEAIWRWSCSGSTQSVGSMVSHLVILMELPFQAHCQEVVQVAKTFSKPWGTWYQWGRVALQSSIPGGICCGRFRLWYR